MPRRPDTRPTSIYWLYDTRPQKVAEFGPKGQPFYCGKTVTPKHRLATHKSKALKFPNREHSKRLVECGEYLTMEILEVIQPNCGWPDRERYWISVLRLLFPGGTNMADGGTGSPGFIQSREQVERRAAMQRGKKATPEHRAKVSAALKGRKHSDEHRAKNAAAKRGKKQSPEVVEKRVSRIRGIKRPPEFGARISATLTGRKYSPERIAKSANARRGVKTGPRSAEYCAKISAMKKAWWAAKKQAEVSSCPI